MTIQCNCSFAVLILAWTPIAMGGELYPPAGPVAPTPGPEPRIAINQANTPGDADSVFRISSPGSYYLAFSVGVGPGDSGIEIASSDVTVDLNGFRITESFPGGLDGIVVLGGSNNVSIRNGVIDGVGEDGIDAANSRGCLFENLSVRNCGETGIRAGAEARIVNCSASGNAGDGLVTSSNCVLQSCTAELNGESGFALSFSCVARDCTANANTLSGFSSGVGSSLVNCTALANSTTGITLGAGSRASQCAAYLNGSNGFSGLGGNLLESCVARDNSGDGFSILSDSFVIGCLSFSNNVHGFHVSSDQSCLTGNKAADNVDRGILVDGDETTIDGNDCTGNAVGLDLSNCNGHWAVRNILHNNSTVDFFNPFCNPIISVNHSPGLQNLLTSDSLHAWSNIGGTTDNGL